MISIELTLNGGSKVLLKSTDSKYQLCDPRSRKGIAAVDWHPFQNCDTLKEALNQLLELEIRLSTAKQIKTLLANLAEARKEIAATARRIAA